MKRNLHAGKSRGGGFSLHTFTDDELYEIHLATLEVLDKTGVFVENEAAVEILVGGGGRYDSASRIVRCRFSRNCLTKIPI